MQIALIKSKRDGADRLQKPSVGKANREQGLLVKVKKPYMKNLWFILLFVTIVSASCKKEEFAPGVPKCVRKEVRKYERSERCTDGMRVEEYLFQGEKVYVFGRSKCIGADFSYPVRNQDCEVLGSLGGIAGNHIINGEDFDNAVFVRIVWENK